MAAAYSELRNFSKEAAKTQVKKANSKSSNGQPKRPSDESNKDKTPRKKVKKEAKKNEHDFDIPDESMGDFYCRYCDAHMNAPLQWQNHITGKRHIKIKTKQDQPTDNKYGYIEEDPFVKVEIQNVTDFIVGLEHICEIQRQDQVPIYQCFMCSAHLSCSTTLIEHLVSLKHRLAFLREHEIETYTLIKDADLKKGQIEPVVAEYIEKYENKHGRGKMQVKREKPKSEQKEVYYPKAKKAEKKAASPSHPDEEYSLSIIPNKKDRPFLDERDRPFLDERDRPFLDERDRPFLDERDRPYLDERDRPFLDERDRPFLDERDRPYLDERDRPFLDERDRPFLDERDRPYLDERDQPYPVKRDRMLDYRDNRKYERSMLMRDEYRPAPFDRDRESYEWERLRREERPIVEPDMYSTKPRSLPDDPAREKDSPRTSAQRKADNSSRPGNKSSKSGPPKDVDGSKGVKAESSANINSQKPTEDELLKMLALPTQMFFKLVKIKLETTKFTSKEDLDLLGEVWRKAISIWNKGVLKDMTPEMRQQLSNLPGVPTVESQSNVSGNITAPALSQPSFNTIISNPLNQMVSQPFNQMVTQPLNQMVAQPLNQMVAQPLNQMVAQPLNQMVASPMLTQTAARPIIPQMNPGVARPTLSFPFSQDASVSNYIPGISPVKNQNAAGTSSTPSDSFNFPNNSNLVSSQAVKFFNLMQAIREKKN